MILILLGLIFGSFISALTWRYPRKISNIKGRSFCDSCKNELYWYDNIPFLSYIFLGGKCRNCNKKISPRYPVIELITAAGFYVIGFNFINLALFIALFSIFIIDFEHQIIPDGFIFFGMLLVCDNFFAGFLSASFLLFIHLLTRGRGMGLGDVKFAVLGGMIVGVGNIYLWFLIAFLTGGLMGSILLLAKKAGLKDRIAFGPFLVIAIPIVLIWGEKIQTLLL